MQKTYGFTIVELLIVVVVIAILAALSYVGYVNISDRANDSTVQSDLSQFAKQVQLIYAEKGEYPAGSRAQTSASVGSGGYFDVPGFKFRPSTSAYLHPTGSGDANFGYCTGPDLMTGQQGFNILALSKSRRAYGHSSIRGAESRGFVGIGEAATCFGLGYPRSYAYGYTSATGWQPWTQ